LAAQRLEELAQLNNDLESAAGKIDELKRERDLLLGDKELLTSAVNDAYRTHCAEVKRVFLDNLKQTRSVGTQLDCCVCAMRPNDNIAIPLAQQQQQQQQTSPAFGNLTSNSVSSADRGGYGYQNDLSSNNSNSRREKSRGAKGHFRGSGTGNKYGAIPPSASTKVNIVVDKTGQRYPFNVGGSYRNVSVGNGPPVRGMDTQSLGLLLPRNTPIGAAISSGKLVPSSSDLRGGFANSFDSIKPPPLPWAPLLPTDRARLEAQAQSSTSAPSSLLLGEQNFTEEFEDGEGENDLRDDLDPTSTWSEIMSSGNQQILDDALSNHLDNERQRAALLSKTGIRPHSRSKKALSPIHHMGSQLGIQQFPQDADNDADLSFVPTVSHFVPPAPPKQKSNFGQQTEGFGPNSAASVGSEGSSLSAHRK
jgi:hypothetical protein